MSRKPCGGVGWEGGRGAAIVPETVTLARDKRNYWAVEGGPPLRKECHWTTTFFFFHFLRFRLCMTEMAFASFTRAQFFRAKAFFPSPLLWLAYTTATLVARLFF